MKTIELFKLSLRYLKENIKRFLLPMLMICISLVAVCFSITGHINVREKKGLPVTLSFTPNENVKITDEVYSSVMSIDGIVSASPTIAFSAEISLNSFKKQLSVIAIDSGMIEQRLIEGEFYPENSNMPYIVMSKADYLSFLGVSASSIVDIPKDALMTNISFDVGGERPYVAQICGILEEGENAMAYTGLDTARRILGEGGAYTSLDTHLTSSYAADNVINALSALGFTESGGIQMLLNEWEIREAEANFLLASAIILLTCSLFFFRYVLLFLVNSKRNELTLLHDLGLPLKRVKSIFRGIGLFAGLCNGFTTVIACISAPFLVMETSPDSIFALTMPWYLIVAGLGLSALLTCISTFRLAAFKAKV